MARAIASAVAAAVLLFTIAVNAEAAVYWGNGTPIGRVNLDGAFPESNFIPRSLVPGPDQGPYVACGGLAVDALHVYWANSSSDTIGRANLDGSGADHSFIVGASNPCGVAVNATHIFWANHQATQGTEPSIGRATIDGAAVDQGFIDGLNGPCDVTLSDTHIFWDAATDNQVGQADLSGKNVIPTFMENAGGGCGIAVDAHHIFWSDLETAIGRADLDGTDPDATFISGLDSPCGVEIHAGRLFWVEHMASGPGSIGPGRIGVAGLNGSGVNRNLLTGLYDHPCGIAVDSLAFLPKPPTPFAASQFSFGCRGVFSYRRTPWGQMDPPA